MRVRRCEFQSDRHCASGSQTYSILVRVNFQPTVIITWLLVYATHQKRTCILRSEELQTKHYVASKEKKNWSSNSFDIESKHTFRISEMTSRVGSNVGPATFIKLVRCLAFWPVGTVDQFRNAFLSPTCQEKEQALPIQFRERVDVSTPFRRNILVADACERIWPPIGLRAPPATKVIVAPGSAE